MVVTAREEASKDHEIVQRKNDQLKAQLADTESLLKSHQEQLAELKHLMEQMNAERDDQANSTAPSTPGNTRFDSNVSDKFYASPSTCTPDRPGSL
jgi:cell shape-determining protein MreC